MLKFCRTCLLKSNDIEMLKMSEKVIFGEEIIDLTNMIMTCVGIEVGILPVRSGSIYEILLSFFIPIIKISFRFLYQMSSQMKFAKTV